MIRLHDSWKNQKKSRQVLMTLRNAHQTTEQDGCIYNRMRAMVGYVSCYGFVYDEQRTLLGYVNQQGHIRSAHLRTIGHVQAQGMIMDEHWKLIGYVTQDGVVYEAGDGIIGYVKLCSHPWPFSLESAAFFLLTALRQETNSNSS